MLFEALLNKGTLPLREGFQSGQMGRAVNPLTSVFESSNLSPSTIQYSLTTLECYSWGCAGVVQW